MSKATPSGARMKITSTDQMLGVTSSSSSRLFVGRGTLRPTSRMSPAAKLRLRVLETGKVEHPQLGTGPALYYLP